MSGSRSSRSKQSCANVLPENLNGNLLKERRGWPRQPTPSLFMAFEKLLCPIERKSDTEIANQVVVAADSRSYH